MAKRRNFSPGFKAKVALAAIRGDQIKRLQAKIGEFVVARDFLAKAFNR